MARHPTLTALEHAERDYLVVLGAGRGGVVSVPPFDGVDFSLDDLFEAETPGPPPAT